MVYWLKKKKRKKFQRNFDWTLRGLKELILKLRNESLNFKAQHVYTGLKLKLKQNQNSPSDKSTRSVVLLDVRRDTCIAAQSQAERGVEKMSNN